MTASSADRLFIAAEDIRGLRLPMPPPLEWVNVYFLRDGDGWAMVDTGYNTPESREILQDALATGLDGLPITRVIVTHYHPDHIGQAGWVCAQYNCPLYMTQTEWLLARWLSTDTTDSYRQTINNYYRNAGTPQAELDFIIGKGNTFRNNADEVPPSYVRLIDHESITIGKRNWQVMIGRGHAPEMILLYDGAGKFLISADQIVARITPNISIWAFDVNANPLKEFFDSSEFFLRALPDDVMILPGHGRPFVGFHERVAGFTPHHEKRLNVLRSALNDTPQSLYELMKIIFPRDLSHRDFVFAMGEAHSHINYLLARGEAKLLPGAAFLYQKG